MVQNLTSILLGPEHSHHRAHLPKLMHQRGCRENLGLTGAPPPLISSAGNWKARGQEVKGMEPRNQGRQGRGPALRESQSPCGKGVLELWASGPSVKPLEQVQVQMNE